jgi:hypothetical protein
VASSEHEDRTLDSPADVNNSTTNLSNHSRIERPSTPKLAATEDSPQAGPLSLPGSELRVNFDTPTQQESNAPNWALSRRQNPIESESNLRNHNRASELQAELFGARIEWPEGGYRHFIPISVLEQSITFESVGIELRRCRGRFLDQVVHRETALEIMSNARKLFAILVYLGQSQYIWELLNEKLDDKDLPLVRSDKTTNFKLCSKLHPRKPIRCLADWERSNIDEFARDQWSMMAPIFKHTEEVSHLELDDNDVLPFTEDNEHSNQGVEYGGFGSVWEVKIHHAHHDLYISTKVMQASSHCSLGG